jgi:hypothetical protein
VYIKQCDTTEEIKGIFIDYCPAAAIQRKMEEKERDTALITE